MKNILVGEMFGMAAKEPAALTPGDTSNVPFCPWEATDQPCSQNFPLTLMKPLGCQISTLKCQGLGLDDAFRRYR